jgi:hypothetical protein
MNLKKDKDNRCVFGDHKGDVSIVFVISTVGISPRMQQTTKSVRICFPDLRRFNALLRSEVSEVVTPSIQALTGKQERKSDVREWGSQLDLTSALSIVGRHAANARWKKHKEKRHGRN